jgi:glycosyltransferase involved in cell wall biosynthesis
MRKAAVVVIGPFPEPIQGAAIVTEKLFDLLVARGAYTSRIDLSPGPARGWRYHLTRLMRATSGFLSILSSPLSRRHIMSVDGGAGLIYNVLIALAVRLRRQPLMLYHHSTRYIFADSLLMRLLIAVSGPDAHHAMCSATMLRLFRVRYNVKAPAIVINNAAWIDVPEGVARQRRGRLRLGHLSGLKKEKGLDSAIATLRELRRRGIDAELVLAGAPQDATAQHTIGLAQAEFGDAMTYTGILTGSAKAAFYANLDYFLFPSLYDHETQSLVVPEALAAGTPVVAFDHRFVGELLASGGLLIPPEQSFSTAASDWILSKNGQDRRTVARRQLETLRKEAAGQITLVISWALSGVDGDEDARFDQHAR